MVRTFSFCTDDEAGMVEFHAYNLTEGEAESLFGELYQAHKGDPRIRFRVLSGDDIMGTFQGGPGEALEFADRLAALGFREE